MSQTTTVAIPGAPADQPSLFASLVRTTKPGITRLVTITAVVGYVLAALQRSWTWAELVVTALGCTVGTALSAAGANAINQWMERDRDAAMVRTARRPLPAGHLAPRVVLGTGVALAAAGVAALWGTVGWVPAGLSAACTLVYTLAYTPLKPRTSHATYVGTIPGALPPLIGWTAASAAGGAASLLEPGGLSLFMLMTVWQIPHFLAIALMHRDDYKRGGFCVLPGERNGEPRTIATILVWSVLLLPATIIPGLVMPNLGWAYAGVAAVSGVAFLWLAVRLALGPSRSAARALFFGSIAHLPLLLVGMVGIALVRVLFRP